MSFSDMVTQSVFARSLAIGLLALVMASAVVIASVDLVMGREVPGMIATIIGVGIGTAGNIIGVNFGVVLQPLPSPKKPAPPATTTSTLPAP